MQNSPGRVANVRAHTVVPAADIVDERLAHSSGPLLDGRTGGGRAKGRAWQQVHLERQWHDRLQSLGQEETCGARARGRSDEARNQARRER
jgi:hypothetical protein